MRALAWAYSPMPNITVYSIEGLAIEGIVYVERSRVVYLSLGQVIGPHQVVRVEC